MDKNRRKFLKIILLGAGTFMAGKILGPIFSNSLSDPPPRSKTSKFKIIEDEKILSVRDSSGEEIFQIDKSS